MSIPVSFKTSLLGLGYWFGATFGRHLLSDFKDSRSQDSRNQDYAEGTPSEKIQEIKIQEVRDY
jgi:hypothetical protein